MNEAALSTLSADMAVAHEQIAELQARVHEMMDENTKQREHATTEIISAVNAHMEKSLSGMAARFEARLASLMWKAELAVAPQRLTVTATATTTSVPADAPTDAHDVPVKPSGNGSKVKAPKDL
jgi:predicted  nucleic acid-binding Zn-ribbon protein